MAKCAACGKRIKNVYTWDGKEYGRECWKVIALPAIEEQRKRAEHKRLFEWNREASIMIEVLRAKDLRKIKNEFKLRVIPQLVEQFDRDGWLSKKQRNMALDWLNNRDMVRMTEMKYELGMINDVDYWYAIYNWGTPKQSEVAEEEYEKANKTASA
jgi:hypothetical protein